MRVFAVYFWHSEGWTPRNEALVEAVVKQARTARHLRLVARDANMSPVDLKESLWYKSRDMFIKAPEQGISICRSKGTNGELIKRTHDSVVASQSLMDKMKNMKLVEDSECLQTSSSQKASAPIDFTIRFAKKLMVEPSATVGLGLHSTTRMI